MKPNVENAALALMAKLDTEGEDITAEKEALREALAQPERHELQKAGQHPAPCARFCEANAYQIEVRRLKASLAKFGGAA